MPAAYVTDFTNLGKYIKAYRSLETERGSLVTIGEEASAIFDDSADEQEALKSFLTLLRALDAGLVNYKAQIVAAAKRDIIQLMLAGNVNYTGTSKDVIGILEKLAEDMTGVDTINGSAVAAGAVTYLDANAGTFLLAISSVSQLVDNEAFEVEALSATRCKITGEPGKHGGISTQLVSGANSILDANGQTLFVATLTIYTAGTGYKLSGDATNIISAYTFTGAVKGTNTSAAGDLYPSVVDDGGGDWHVDIYKDSGRTSKVAHTATFTATGAKALVADGGSGLTGSVTVAALTAVADAVVRCGFTLTAADKARFATTNDDGGKFAKFFREALGVAVPVDTGGSETIADTLCE